MDKIRVGIATILATPKQTGDGTFLVVSERGPKHSILSKYADGKFSVGEDVILWDNIGTSTYYRSITKE